MYLDHKDLSKYWAGDLEANGLTPDTVWVVCLQNIATGEWFQSRDYNDIRVWFHLHRNDYFAFHNGIGYDLPTLRRVVGAGLLLEHHIDTLVLSYLYHPQAPDGHSLEAWGERLGLPKIGHDEWDRYTPAMLERCRRDVEITRATFLALTDRMRDRGFSERSCWIEHHFADIIRRQRENGFYFDRDNAQKLYARLRELEGISGQTIHELFPRELRPVGEYRYRTTKTGKPFNVFERHRLAYPKVELDEASGTYTVWDYHEFNIGSPQQRVQRLLSLGWEPEQFNPPTKKMREEGIRQGSPKVDEDSITAFVKVLAEQGDTRGPQVQAIADWLYLNGRGNMIGTWLANVKDDSCIHGFVASCGAASRRCIHNSPNTANIPSNEAKYGRECRSLWRPRPGRVLLGYDAKSAQMRLFGHYLKNPDATRFYLGEFGDPHKVNGESAGIPRPKAKNCFYALIFGAQDPKLGKTGAAGGDRALGHKIRRALYTNTPGLEKAIDDAQGMYQQYGGWLPCLDGGWVRCPSPHAALNYLIQPAEAVLMKLLAIKLDQEVTERGLEGFLVGSIHDEAQWDVRDEETAHEIGRASERLITEAGEELGITVKMEGAHKVGADWSETH